MIDDNNNNSANNKNINTQNNDSLFDHIDTTPHETHSNQQNEFIRTNNNTNNENFLNFFSRKADQIEETTERPRVAAETCRRRATAAKPLCVNCQLPVEDLQYDLETILGDNMALKDIQEDLAVHGHAQTKKNTDRITGQDRWRTRDESARELADHYKSIHNQKEPLI
jgi:hypothetical protein